MNYTSWKLSKSRDFLKFSRGIGVKCVKQSWKGFIDSFVPNAPFLYPLKTSENLTVFWCFQGVGKECIGSKWVKTDKKMWIFCMHKHMLILPTLLWWNYFVDIFYYFFPLIQFRSNSNTKKSASFYVLLAYPPKKYDLWLTAEDIIQVTAMSP